MTVHCDWSLCLFLLHNLSWSSSWCVVTICWARFLTCLRVMVYRALIHSLDNNHGLFGCKRLDSSNTGQWSFDLACVHFMFPSVTRQGWTTPDWLCRLQSFRTGATQASGPYQWDRDPFNVTWENERESFSVFALPSPSLLDDYLCALIWLKPVWVLFKFCICVLLSWAHTTILLFVCLLVLFSAVKQLNVNILKGGDCFLCPFYAIFKETHVYNAQREFCWSGKCEFCHSIKVKQKDNSYSSILNRPL